jgi:hypothetical protein
MASSTRLVATILLAAAAPIIGTLPACTDKAAPPAAGSTVSSVSSLESEDLKIGTGAGGVIPPGATLVFEVTLTGIE